MSIFTCHPADFAGIKGFFFFLELGVVDQAIGQCHVGERQEASE